MAQRPIKLQLHGHTLDGGRRYKNTTSKTHDTVSDGHHRPQTANSSKSQNKNAKKDKPENADPAKKRSIQTQQNSSRDSNGNIQTQWPSTQRIQTKPRSKTAHEDRISCNLDWLVTPNNSANTHPPQTTHRAVDCRVYRSVRNIQSGPPPIIQDILYIQTNNIWHSTLKHTKTLKTHILCRSSWAVRARADDAAPNKWSWWYTERAERTPSQYTQRPPIRERNDPLHVIVAENCRFKQCCESLGNRMGMDRAFGNARGSQCGWLCFGESRIYENCNPALYTVIMEVISCRQTGQRLQYCLLRSAHSLQYAACPQGAITVLTSCSVQIQHTFFSSLSPC